MAAEVIFPCCCFPCCCCGCCSCFPVLCGGDVVCGGAVRVVGGGTGHFGCIVVVDVGGVDVVILCVVGFDGVFDVNWVSGD